MIEYITYASVGGGGMTEGIYAQLKSHALNRLLIAIELLPDPPPTPIPAAPINSDPQLCALSVIAHLPHFPQSGENKKENKFDTHFQI